MSEDILEEMKLWLFSNPGESITMPTTFVVRVADEVARQRDERSRLEERLAHNELERLGWQQYLSQIKSGRIPFERINHAFRNTKAITASALANRNGSRHSHGERSRDASTSDCNSIPRLAVLRKPNHSRDETP
jgi:hypothetical protein